VPASALNGRRFLIETGHFRYHDAVNFGRRACARCYLPVSFARLPRTAVFHDYPRSLTLNRGRSLDTLLHFVNLVLHIDKFLGDFIHVYGAWVYAVLFLIVFAETGLVILPFLPGDSLLFIGGAFCATGEMNLGLLILLLLVASVGGNTLNYAIGRAIGPRVFNSHIPFLERFLDRKALQKTHNFYEKHGGKTIVLARFIPVVRTFAPFVAGASEMTVSRFQLFNVVGALLWVLLLVLLGYFFGNIPFIRQYLNVIVLVGIGAAIVPVLLGALWKMLRKDDAKAGSR
jgi:membrane-associated protein